ncbi:MAG: glycosyltransferase family 39 protein, partial [Anaerolineae bacterium]
MWWDESLSLQRAESNLESIVTNRISFAGGETIDQHPPIYFLLLHAVVQLAGSNDMALRFPSACLAAAIVPLLYVFARRIRNETSGLLAASIGALSPFLLWYAQEARMYTLITFLGLLSTLLLWRALTSHQWHLYLVYGAVFAIGLLTQYLFVLLFPAQLLCAFIIWRTRPHRVRFRWQRWLAIAGLAIPLLIFAGVCVLAIQRIPELGSNRTYVPLWIMTRDIFSSFALGLSVNYFKIWPLEVFFWALFIFGIITLVFRAQRNPWEVTTRAPVNRVALPVLLFGYIFIPILGMWLFSFITPLYMGSRYLLMSLPAFILCVAIGLENLFSHSRIIGPFVLFILAGSMNYSILRYYTAPEYNNKEDYRSAAHTIAENESSADVIIVNGAEIEAVFRHYYEGNLPIVPLPTLNSSWQNTQNTLQNLANKYDRIWLVEGNKQITDPSERVRGWLTSQTVSLSESTYNGYVYPVRLSSYFPRTLFTDTPVSSSEVVGVFGDQLQLDSLSLRYFSGTDSIRQDVNAQSAVTRLAQVPAGRTIGVFVTSTVLSTLSDLKTSLRILDDQDRLVAQRDDVPLIYNPSSTWPVGKNVQFQTYLRIPLGTPPGTYRLALLMYRRDNSQGLGFQPPQGEPQAWYQVCEFSVTEGKPYTYEQFTFPDNQERLKLPVVFGQFELLGYKLPDRASGGTSLTLPMYWQLLKGVD